MSVTVERVDPKEDWTTLWPKLVALGWKKVIAPPSATTAQLSVSRGYTLYIQPGHATNVNDVVASSMRWRSLDSQAAVRRYLQSMRGWSSAAHNRKVSIGHGVSRRQSQASRNFLAGRVPANITVHDRQRQHKLQQELALEQRQRRAQKRAEIYALNAALERADTVSSGGLILVAVGSNFYKQATTISAFHPASGMWRDFGRTLQPRCNAATCVLPAGVHDVGGNTVVCAGGYLPGVHMLDQHFSHLSQLLHQCDEINHQVPWCLRLSGGHFSRTVEIFVPSKRQSWPLPPMPAGAYGARAAVVNQSPRQNIGGPNNADFSTTRTSTDELLSSCRSDGRQSMLRQHKTERQPSSLLLVMGGQSDAAVGATKKTWCLDLTGLDSAGCSESEGSLKARIPNWVAGPKMLVARRFFSAVVIPDGRVLICGGQSEAGLPLRSVELYDPNVGCWFSMPPMAAARFAHAAAMLPDGRVGVFGSHTRSTGCEAFKVDDNNGGVWEPLPPMWHGRAHGCATTIRAGTLRAPGGGVFIAGGTEKGGATAEMLLLTHGCANHARRCDQTAPWASWQWRELDCPQWVAGPTGHALRECASVLLQTGQPGGSV